MLPGEGGLLDQRPDELLYLEAVFDAHDQLEESRRRRDKSWAKTREKHAT